MWEFLSKYTGLPVLSAQALITVECDALGNFSFLKWEIEGMEPPTQEQIGEALSAPPELPQLKTFLKAQIDSQAENERLKYITPGVGQSMTYTEKVDQASTYSKAYTAYLNDPDNTKAPNANEYLLLQSSLGIDGDTLAEVAENITWAYALWEQVGAAIETIRLQSKALIDAAKTGSKVQAIFDAVKWP